MARFTFAEFLAAKGAQLLLSGEDLRGFPYLFAAIQFSAGEDRAKLISVAASEFIKRRGTSHASNDLASTQIYDDLIRSLPSSEQSPLSEAEATWRADRRTEDGLNAWSNNELEVAATHLLAAAALSPGGSKTQQARGLVARSISDRIRKLNLANLTEEQLLELVIAVTVEVGCTNMLRLAEWLYLKMDFELALCISRRAGDRSDDAGACFQAEFLILKSKSRLAGASMEEAEKQSVEKIVRTLVQYGPPSGLTNELLCVRGQFSLIAEYLSLARSDLTELLRRATTDIANLRAAARNTLVVSRNALNWDFREAIKILAAGNSQAPGDLPELLHLAWSGGEMETTLRLAETASEHNPSYSIMPILHEMALDLTLQPIKTIGSARQGPFKIYANVVCWGDEHIRLMERAMLASLLSPRNFPTLAQSASIHLDLFTMPSEIERIANSPRIQKLGEHCEIRLFTFPPKVVRYKKVFPHMILGFAQHSTVLRAQAAGADYLQLYPDLIFADGSYATVARHLTRAPISLLADNLNAYEEPVLAALIDDDVVDGALIATPTQLLTAVSGYLTRRSLDQVHRPEATAGPDSPVKTIFPLPHGLAMHSFYANPVYVSHAALNPLPVKNFAVTDGFFTEHLLEKKSDDDLKILTSPEYLCVELCKDDGTLFAHAEGTLAARIKNMVTSSFSAVTRKRIFEHRNFFSNVRINDHQTLTVQAVDAVVSEILDMFETDRALSDLQRERWEIEQGYRDAVKKG